MAGNNQHLTLDELDLWLDGGLPTARTSHLETCLDCRTVAEETREIARQLASLHPALPSPDLADRVMARVRLTETAAHLTLDEVDLWLDRGLPMERERHLLSCSECRERADEERILVEQLRILPLFSSRAGLADRVMARVDLPMPTVTEAWDRWRMAVRRKPVSVGMAAALSLFLGGSLTASAFWAASHEGLITGFGPALLASGRQWFWQAAASAVSLLGQQGWYHQIRTALTPEWMAAFAGLAAGLYATGLLAFRRLVAIPSSISSRALP